MPLTLEQIDKQIIRAANLYREAEQMEKLAHQTFISILIFLVIGIFFFPV